MNQEQWTAVSTYFCDLLVRSDVALDTALTSSDEAGEMKYDRFPSEA